MSKNWLKYLANQKEVGRIRGYEVVTKESVKKGDVPVKGPLNAKSRKGQKIKNWIALNLWYWCKANGYLLLKEQLFDEKRKWRFDWFICGLKVGIEYEGLMSEKSRHTTIKGFTGDSDKYNAAQSKGIKLLRFTALNYKQLITELEKIK